MWRIIKALLVCLVLLVPATASAWWNTPYAQAYRGWGYGPYTWPAYGAPNRYGYNPYGYGYSNPDWNIRGTVSGSGNAHVIIEYNGNIYEDFFGGNRSWPGNRSYGWSPYSGSGRW